MPDLILDIPRARFTPVSLELPEDFSKEDWLAVVRRLNRANVMVNWWLGDCIAFGERKWGQTTKLLAELTEFNYGTLRNLATISRSVHLSLRRDNLPFAYFVEVAPLTPREQKRWLKEAESHQWPIRELRERIRSRQATHSLKEPDYIPHESPTRWARQLAAWLEGLPADWWDEERRKHWRNELAPLHRAYVSLTDRA